MVVSSAAAWITEGPIANTGYCVSKLAQMRIVEMVGRQFEREGVLAVGVHPGAVKTEMAESAPEEFKKCLVSLILFFCFRLLLLLVLRSGGRGLKGRESLLTRCADLTDSPDLCGAFCVWLTKNARDRAWLSGRFVSANWNVDELEGRKDDIVSGDLLKGRLILS